MPALAPCRPCNRLGTRQPVCVIQNVGSATTSGAAAPALRSREAGSEYCLRDLQKGIHQPGTQRSSGPKEAYVPGEPVAGNGQFPQRQTFRPRRRPIGHERYPQASIDHDRDRFKPIKFKSLLGPNAGVTEIAVNKAPRPACAVQSNEGLRGQGNIGIADRCRRGSIQSKAPSATRANRRFSGSGMVA